MRAATTIYLYKDDIRFFGEGPYRLLRGIEESGSLRAAAAKMNLSYSKAIAMVNRAEEALGFSLTEKRIGAQWNGKSFLQTALELTEGVFAKRVVVTRSEEAAAYCKQKDVDVILHKLPLRSDTVRLGTTFMEDMEGILFCPCDQPMLRRESLLKLRNAFSFEGKNLLRLAYGEKQGMPALFGKEYMAELKQLPEGKGGSYILEKYKNKIERIFVLDELELFDVDTKEELEKLKNSASV